jgi:hypothetical protein
MRPYFKALLALIGFIAVVQILFGQQGTGSIRFRFAFGALTGSNNRNLVPITEDAYLKTGDRIKLMAQMEQPGFIYVIHRSPDGELDILLPADLKQNVQLAKPYSMPEGASWFELDRNPGDETFYVLASTQRLSSLESLLQRYSTAAPAAKPLIAADVVTEIRRLRTQNRDGAAQAERPVMIGGNVRGLETANGPGAPDLNSIAVEFTAKDFFARTFTINHR